MTKFYTFILPAHNEEQSINRALNSLFAQKLGKEIGLNIYVVCNGCTDNTEKVARKYTKTYSIKEKNVSLARNYGGNKVSGEVMVFLDADTLINKNIIEKINNIKSNSFFGTCKVKPDDSNLMNNLYCRLKNLFGLLGIHNASGIIFCSKNIFDKVKFNGDIAVHENQDFSKHAKKYGKRYFLNSYVITSMRRYDKLGYFGVLKYTIRRFFLKDKYYPAIR